MAKIQARVPDNIQAAATKVLQANGLTISEAIRLLMTRIAHDKALPIEIFGPNQETLAAMQELDEGKGTTVTFDEFAKLVDADFAGSKRKNA